MNSPFWQRGLFLAEALMAVATSFMGSSTPDEKPEAASMQSAPLVRRSPGCQTKQQDAKLNSSAEFKANQPQPSLR
jgi:hypothetical protein